MDAHAALDVFKRADKMQVLVITIIGAGLSLVLTLIKRIVSTASARRKFSIENGCAPVLNRYRHKDPLGLDFIFAQVKAFREKRLLDQINDNHAALGTTFSGRAFTQPFVATTDPENIKTVLAVRFKDYNIGSVRAPRLGPLLGRGIFVTDGQEWAHSRSMLRPNFSKDQVADLDMVKRHIQHLLAAVEPGTTVDLQRLFARFTLDSSTEFLFGQSTNSQLGGEFASRSFSDNLDFSFKQVALELRMGALARLRSPADRRRRDRAYKMCRLYVAGFVDQAIAMRTNDSSGQDKNPPRSFFLKELAESSHNRERITDALLNLLFAGRDTTASLLSSLFLVLASRRDIWDKLRKETASLGGRAPTYAQLRDLKYARNCLSETLRLWPPVPTNVRYAACDTVLPRGGGLHGDEPIFVPKGHVVQYNVHSMHRRADLYGADAEFFRPERWEKRTHSWDFLPFNGGARICLGQQYALTEALMVLVMFSQEFVSINLKDKRPWTESLTLTACHAHGVHVELAR